MPPERPNTFEPVPFHWIAIPVAIAAVLLLMDSATDIDRIVTRFFYDAEGGRFPLRTSFWLDVVMHHWTKYAVATVGCLSAGALLLSFVLPTWKAHRRVLLFVTLAMALAPLSVTVGKAASPRHCPWDVDEFGGVVRYERLFESNAPNVKPGRCFPAGHASTGFALMAFYFAAYSRRMRKAARLLLVAGIMAGLTLGFGRVLQGAHFVSHVLWSGLLCWAVMVMLYALCLRVAPAEARRPIVLAKGAG